MEIFLMYVLPRLLFAAGVYALARYNLESQPASVAYALGTFVFGLLGAVVAVLIIIVRAHTARQREE